MSYGFFSNRKEGVNTTPFRRSIWNYVHRIFGVLHDDFNYKHVNICLTKKIKMAVKKVVCYPNEIKKEDLDFGLNLIPSEKIHVVLLATEARKQAEILYGLHAVMKYQTN